MQCREKEVSSTQSQKTPKQSYAETHFYCLVASDSGPEGLCVPHHLYTSNMSDQFSRINSLEMESQVHLKQPKVASRSWSCLCSAKTPDLFQINYSLSEQITPLLSWQNWLPFTSKCKTWILSFCFTFNLIIARFYPLSSYKSQNSFEYCFYHSSC